MKLFKVLKWIIYIILIGAALIDAESRSILMFAFFAIASICSGINITEREKRKKNEETRLPDGRFRNRTFI